MEYKWVEKVEVEVEMGLMLLGKTLLEFRLTQSELKRMKYESIRFVEELAVRFDE